MATYTEQDLYNAKLYADERLKLVRLQDLNNRNHRNVSKNLRWTIYQADKDKDYYYPDSFKNRALKVKFDINEDLCTIINCMSYKIDGDPSAPTDVAQNYQLGYTASYDVQCQPACFNMRPIDYTNDEPTVQALPTVF